MLVFLARVSDTCRERGVALDAAALPTGLRNLLDLAVAVPERVGARKELSAPPFLERLGAHALAVAAEGGETLSFLGNPTLASFGWSAGAPAIGHPTSAVDPAVRHRGAPDCDADQFLGGYSRIRQRRPAQTVRARSTSPIWSAWP
jgi:hypothetical protein